MISYPLYFQVAASAEKGIAMPFSAKADNYPTIHCTIPEGFNGPGGGYSPEDLFALANTTCFIATFKVFAEKSGLSYEEIAGQAKLTVDRLEGGVPMFTKLELQFSLRGVQDQKKARLLLEEAQKNCLVANASKAETIFNYSFV